MHLKNFSLIAKDRKNDAVAPTYDMVAVELLIPEDQEELALNLNEKKRKLKWSDFNEAMNKSAPSNKSHRKPLEMYRKKHAKLARVN